LLQLGRSGTIAFSPPHADRLPSLHQQAGPQAGKLDDPASERDAIDTYKKALLVEPENPLVLSQLARIQTYSSRLLSTDQQRLAVLEEARDNIRHAADLAPDDSQVLAIKAFVLDWNASSNLIANDEREAYLAEAEAAANRAYLLDPENALALAFYAEVLLDQQKWDQALEYAAQAVERAPDNLDTHRVFGTVLESVGLYGDAIREYKRASELAPNLTFILLQIGLGYRNLEDYDSCIILTRQRNCQLGIRPPPYVPQDVHPAGVLLPATPRRHCAFQELTPTGAGQHLRARNYESPRAAVRPGRCGGRE
jgi:tetratricopeptide (TPR) repeat protein